jgi:hypothetical protein
VSLVLLWWAGVSKLWVLLKKKFKPQKI